MRFFLIVLLVAAPAHAEVYKCVVNGQTEFSDKPCSVSAEKLFINTPSPSDAAVKSQQDLTRTLQQESRFAEIRALNEENTGLKQRILQLQQQGEAEIATLQQRTYQVDDHTIATREHGLFQQINQVRASYAEQIRHIQMLIQQNQQRLSTLQQQP